MVQDVGMLYSPLVTFCMVIITFYQRTLLGASANQKRHYLKSYNNTQYCQNFITPYWKVITSRHNIFKITRQNLSRTSTHNIVGIGSHYIVRITMNNIVRITMYNLIRITRHNIVRTSMHNTPRYNVESGVKTHKPNQTKTINT